MDSMRFRLRRASSRDPRRAGRDRRFGLGARPGPAGTRANSVSAAPDDDGRAYAAATILESATSALYRTDDAGRSWTGLVEAGPGDAFSEVFADPRDGNRVFASAQRAYGCDRCLPFGRPRRALVDRPDSLDALRAFLRRGHGGRLALSDLRHALPAHGRRRPLLGRARDPFTENVRLAPGPAADPVCLRRIARLSEWRRRHLLGAGRLAPPACPGLLALAADPGDSNVLLAGTGVIGAGGFQCGGVYRSVNGGTTWGDREPFRRLRHRRRVRPRPVAPAPTPRASFIAGILPPGGVYDKRRWRPIVLRYARLPVTGALGLSVSATGRFVYAATRARRLSRTASRRTRLVPER